MRTTGRHVQLTLQVTVEAAEPLRNELYGVTV